MHDFFCVSNCVCKYVLYCAYIYLFVHSKNTIFKIINSLVSTIAWKSGNCNLIGCLDFYGYTYHYNPITVISISLACLIHVQKCRINSLIKSFKVSRPSVCI